MYPEIYVGVYLVISSGNHFMISLGIPASFPPTICAANYPGISAEAPTRNFPEIPPGLFFSGISIIISSNIFRDFFPELFSCDIFRSTC